MKIKLKNSRSIEKNMLHFLYIPLLALSYNNPQQLLTLIRSLQPVQLVRRTLQVVYLQPLLCQLILVKAFQGSPPRDDDELLIIFRYAFNYAVPN